MFLCFKRRGTWGQQVSGHHGRKGERQHHGNNDGDADRHGEFVEQPARKATHKQNGQKNRNERNGNGENGKRHLATAFYGSLSRGKALLYVAGNVFHHHNGIIHHKAGGNRKRHKGHVVQRIAKQRHHPKRGHNGRRHHNGGNKRHSDRVQEQQHHQHNQHHRNNQRKLCIRQRGTDGKGAIKPHMQIHPTGQGGFEHGQFGVDLIHRVDHVGPGLREHNGNN